MNITTDKVNLIDIRKVTDEITKFAESQKNHNGFSLLNAYTKTYKKLKDIGINLYQRRDNYGKPTDNLFDFIMNEYELLEFKKNMVENINNSITTSTPSTAKIPSNTQKTKVERYIDAIKNIANNKVNNRKEFYTTFYRLLVLKQVNLYERRKDRETALIQYITEADFEIINEVMASQDIQKMLIKK